MATEKAKNPKAKTTATKKATTKKATTKKATTAKKKPAVKKTTKKHDVEITPVEVISEELPQQERIVVTGKSVPTEPQVVEVEEIEIETPEVETTAMAHPEKKTKLTIKSDGKVDLSVYTPEEQQKYLAIAKNIKPDDTNSIMSYGVDVQNKLAGQSDQFLDNVRSFDAGEIGESITDLLHEINYIDVDAAEKTGIQKFIAKIPILNKLVKSTQKIFNKYDDVSGNVDNITKKLDQGRLTIIKDNNMLDTLFDSNVDFVEDLEGLIIAGHYKLQEMQNELSEMEANADRYEDYEIADKRDFIDRLSKRLHDMELTRVITIQSLPQIRLVQNNNATMVEKVQSSINTTIPIWKNQLSIAVTLMRQQKMADMQNKIHETTNTMLTKNAEMLRTNSIDIAKQNERGVIDIEAIKKVQENLINTIDEIKTIKAEGETNRKAIALELENLEKGLTEKVQQLN